MSVISLEKTVTIRELQYAYKEWKNTQWSNEACKPVLALHGWLDNAASFDRLAEKLVTVMPVTLIALDLAGHGHSDHRHMQGSYNIWDDLLDIALLVENFEWNTFVLLGHSRGAMISTLFASSCANKVEKLILLDGLLPLPTEPENTPQQLTKHLRDALKKVNLPSYASIADAMNARCRAASMTIETAQLIVERGLFLKADNSYQWRSDARLTHASAVKFSQLQNDMFYKNIHMPSLLLLAEKGLLEYTGSMVSALESNENFTIETLAGASHHLHLEQSILPDIIKHIVPFLQR